MVKGRYPNWYSNLPIGWLCRSCYQKYINAPKYWLNATKRRIRFRGKRVYNKSEVLRIGVCNWCRGVVPFDCKITDTHHESYHEEDPLRDTIEICPKCHNAYHDASQNFKR